MSTKHKKIAAEGNSVITAFNYRENKKAIMHEDLKRRIMNLQKKSK